MSETARQRARQLMKPLFLHPCSREERDVTDRVEAVIEGFAKEISRLSARVKDLEDKLLPFAKAADCFPDREGIVMRLRVSDELDVKITWRDLHEAKRALNPPESDKEGS